MAGPIKHIFEIGQRFGRLTIISPAFTERQTRYYMARCDCGTVVSRRAERLACGSNKSCGCLIAEAAAARSTTHGMSGSPEYLAWCDMRLRCTDEKDIQYPNYGARGIKVCDEWMNSFENFIAHIGRRPSPDHSLDRIDNDVDYQPGNVRCATAKQQVRNRRCTLTVDLDGQEHVFAELCEQRGLPYHIVWQRVYRYGVDLASALSYPVGGRRA